MMLLTKLDLAWLQQDAVSGYECLIFLAALENLCELGSLEANARRRRQL